MSKLSLYLMAGSTRMRVDKFRPLLGAIQTNARFIQSSIHAGLVPVNVFVPEEEYRTILADLRKADKRFSLSLYDEMVPLYHGNDSLIRISRKVSKT